MRPALPVVLVAALAAAGAAVAQTRAAHRPAASATEDVGYAYARDAITVATPGREFSPPSGLCIVWANAEGLGVGPDQLGGMHGLSLALDLSRPNGTTLEQALAGAKGGPPPPPEWLLAAVRARAPAIAKACAELHADPVRIAGLTARDRR